MGLVRAKFVVENKSQNEEGFTVTMRAVCDGSKENEEFFKYTPSGQLDIGLLKPETAAQFDVGREYYLDFSPAE